MEIGRLYEKPFNELSSSPEILFEKNDIDKICNLIDFITQRAQTPKAA